MNRRHFETAQRFAERRRREDEAPRLAAIVPGLATLRLDLRESRAGAEVADVAHSKHVVVDRAPALFVLQCQDPSCKDGGHDITVRIMSALRERLERFEGTDACTGRVGMGDCHRVLNFVGLATYKS